jgi:hypothetical protein
MRLEGEETCLLRLHQSIYTPEAQRSVLTVDRLTTMASAKFYSAKCVALMYTY